jgi:hypothetical protein
MIYGNFVEEKLIIQLSFLQALPLLSWHVTAVARRQMLLSSYILSQLR